MPQPRASAPCGETAKGKKWQQDWTDVGLPIKGPGTPDSVMASARWQLGVEDLYKTGRNNGEGTHGGMSGQTGAVKHTGGLLVPFTKRPGRSSWFGGSQCRIGQPHWLAPGEGWQWWSLCRRPARPESGSRDTGSPLLLYPSVVSS